MSVLRRVVFDTSTLVSAALREDSVPQRAVVHALLAGRVFASPATLAELDQVLSRPKFDRYNLLDVRLDYAAMMRRLVTLIAVTEADEFSVYPPCRDPNDHKYLALVKVSGADALVTSDADLLVLDPWQGVRIVTPAAFLQMAGE